jgi:hypothetical protein
MFLYVALGARIERVSGREGQMGWLMALAAYVLAFFTVVLIAGGTRRGDLRHAAAVRALAALDDARWKRLDPVARVRVSRRRSASSQKAGLQRRFS